MTRAFVVVLMACALAGATACSSSKPKVVPPAAPTDLRGQAQVDIDAAGYQFTPASVIVDSGTTVTWHNKDAVAHNVEKSADTLDFGGKFGADASVFGPGASYSFTFAQPGTYTYTCTIHTDMSGKVEVVAKEDASATTTTALGPTPGG